MIRTFVGRHPVVLLALFTLLLSFGAYLLPLPRAAIPFVLVLIPAIVAIALAALEGGKTEVRALLSRLARWRVDLKWLAIALAVALALRLAMSGAALLLGLIPAIRLTVTSPVQWLLLAVLFLVAAIPEELGWRGYALPRLLARHSPALAALAIGLPWAVVHLALHLPGMQSEGLPWLPTILGLVGLSVVITWIFVRGGQSVVLTSIFHAAQSFFVVVNGGITLLSSQWLLGIAWTVAGLLVLLDPMMWRRPGLAPTEPASEARRGPWSRIGRIMLALLAGLLALGIAGAQVQGLATEVDSHNLAPPGQLVDVGGTRLHIYCIGQGSPAVILDGASLGTVSNWFWVQTEVARTTRVCAYDRPGVGWSDLGPEPSDARQNAEQLHTLLQRAGVNGPYVLVGHSFGGLYVRAYAAQYPGDVAGVVLIEATPPDMWARLGQPEVMPNADEGMLSMGPAAARLGLFRLVTFVPVDPDLPARQQTEMAAYFRSAKFADWMLSAYRQFPNLLAQARALSSLGDVPLTVVIGSASENATGVQRQFQDEMLGLSSNSQEWVVDGANHASLVSNSVHAKETSAAISQVIDRIRAAR